MRLENKSVSLQKISEAQLYHFMEENESSLLNKQQEPENNGSTIASNTTGVEAENAATETQRETIDVAHITAPETNSYGEEAEAMAREVADATTDEPAAVQEEEAPAFEVRTPEELKVMTDLQILDYLKEIAKTRPARPAREAVAAISTEMTARQQAESQPTEGTVDENKEETAAEPEAAEPRELTPTEKEIAALLTAFDAAVAAEKEEARKKMEENAGAKKLLIEQLQQVIKAVEEADPSTMLHTVREIISKWKSIGHIPSSQKSLNKDFKALADEYFEYLNKERELRNYSQKLNLAKKEALCEQAEALDAEPSIRKAYNQAQRLRDTWKTIGPATREENDKIWARFNEATGVIHKKFRQLVAEERVKEKENYEKKKAICEEVEAFLGMERSSRKEFDALADKAQEFVAKWKTIGFAPKSVNDEIYARFRKAIDGLYDIRKAFFKGQDEQYADNYRKKEILCEKAESVMNSSDWRKTADYLIELQREWKDVGPVDHKRSDLIWKRFRGACDTFFNNRQSQKDGETAEMSENLQKKQAIITELEAYETPSDDEQHLNDLKGFVARWNGIGAVPSKDRNNVNKKFSALIDKHYDALNINRADAEMERYRGKLEAMATEGGDRLQKERSRLMIQIRQAEQAAETLENNINFFSKSKNAEKLVNEYSGKIAKAKTEVEQLNKKMAILNEIARR